MESKTVVYTPEAGGGNSGMMAMLAPLLQQKGIDPNCCYGYPFVNAYATGYAAGEGCGCGC